MTPLIFLACCFLPGSDRDDAIRKELTRFEGLWSFARVVVDGKEQTPGPFPTNRMIILRDGRYVIAQGPRITHGTLEVDPTQTPGHYDPTIGQGAARGRTFPGIYEMEGDSFKACLPLRGMERPTGFDSKPGSGLIVFVFKREKQTAGEALTEVARQEMAGTWQAVSYALDGKQASEEDLKNIQLKIDAAGATTALQNGKPFIASTTSIDPSRDPSTIDMKFTFGDAKGKRALGIYKIEDDLLTICRSGPGQQRPTEFASRPGTGHTLMSYRREKPAQK
jgi:uncharacterized protein (TIGR03067 family)